MIKKIRALSQYVMASVLMMFLYLSVPAQETSGRYPWQFFWQQSLAAEAKKDYPAFLENARQAVETGPANHPTLFYILARAHSVNGNRSEAVKWLEKTLEIGFGGAVKDDDVFKFLQTAPEYAALRQKIETIRTPKIAGKTVATIFEADLIPEGVAYDAKEQNIFLGSLYKRKIIKIDRRGKTSDFVAEALDDLGSVVGIKVDAKTRTLLVLSNIAPNMKNFDKLREGTGMLHKYDLESGKLIVKYELTNQPRPHLLNDSVIARNGDLYITDSLSSAVHVLRQGSNELKIFTSLSPYSYPNGIALSKDESRLYVANLNGIALIDIKNGKVSSLEHPANVALAGVDGLYLYQNSLIAIQNFEKPNRVVRFDLSADGERITRARVLESNHPLYQIPTTGVISGRDFYYIANSQLRSFDENGNIFSLDKLRNITVLKLKL